MARHRRPGVAAALLALLVVLAGCSAPVDLPGPEPGSGADERGSADPGDSNRTARSLDDVDLPPGVRSNRTVPEPLVAAHAGGVGDASHVVVRRSLRRSATGTRTGRVVARFGSNRSRLAVRSVVAGPGVPNRTVETYLAGSTRYRRQSRGGETRYSVADALDGAYRAERRAVGSTAFVRQLLEAAEFRPVGVRVRNGTALVVLRASGGGLADHLAGDPNASSVEATMLVTERGVVRGTTVEVRGTPESPVERLTVEVRVERVGETGVREPGWLGEARSASNRSDG